MTTKLVHCVSIPPATIYSSPVYYYYNFAKANEEFAKMYTEEYYPCCGKSICKGCIYSVAQTGNHNKCPFCNAKLNASVEENVEDIMKRVEAIIITRD
jgi:uncharacterized paraquat-inducible protein A